MSIELISKLKGLKPHGMAQYWPEVAAKTRHSGLDPEQWMGELIAAETSEREVRPTAYQMTTARFPAHRELAGFDFSESRTDEALIADSMVANSWKHFITQCSSAAPALVRLICYGYRHRGDSASWPTGTFLLDGSAGPYAGTREDIWPSVRVGL